MFDVFDAPGLETASDDHTKGDEEISICLIRAREELALEGLMLLQHA
jgi:hypothetical protein